MIRGWVTARAVVLSIIAVVTAGCTEEPAEQVERVRAIKPYYVVEPASGNVRHYSGTISASHTSGLGFTVSGTVQTVKVKKGDRVIKGQVLVTLDPKPFALKVQAAQAELVAARAERNNKRTDRDRQRELLKHGWIAKARYDGFVTAYEASKGQLSLARSRLGLAERDMANTRLTAPFDGVIAQRNVNPFTQVSPAHKVLQIDSEGALEVDFSIPDSVISRISIGTPVTLEARTVAGCGCTGRITEIGSVASAGNAVPATAAIFKSPAGLLPGMAAEVSVILTDDRGPGGFLVPLVAIAPGDDKARGYVFKFDPVKGAVRKTPVRSTGAISGNLISITEGVKAGDIVAAAGVSLLRDGQRVKLIGQ